MMCLKFVPVPQRGRATKKKSIDAALKNFNFFKCQGFFLGFWRNCITTGVCMILLNIIKVNHTGVWLFWKIIVSQCASAWILGYRSTKRSSTNIPPLLTLCMFIDKDTLESKRGSDVWLTIYIWPAPTKGIAHVQYRDAGSWRCAMTYVERRLFI